MSNILSTIICNQKKILVSITETNTSSSTQQLQKSPLAIANHMFLHKSLAPMVSYTQGQSQEGRSGGYSPSVPKKYKIYFKFLIFLYFSPLKYISNLFFILQPPHIKSWFCPAYAHPWRSNKGDHLGCIWINDLAKEKVNGSDHSKVTFLFFFFLNS